MSTLVIPSTVAALSTLLSSMSKWQKRGGVYCPQHYSGTSNLIIVSYIQGPCLKGQQSAISARPRSRGREVSRVMQNTAMMKLHRASLELGESCDTSLTSANSSKVCFATFCMFCSTCHKLCAPQWLTTCARLTLQIRIPSSPSL